MAKGSRTLLALIALFVIAPVGAAVIIAVLLLFGVQPHWVFLPGFFVRAKLQAMGFRAPNAVGVLSTVALWWVIIVAVWLAVRRLRRLGA